MLKTHQRVLNASVIECLMLQTYHIVLNASDTPQSAYCFTHHRLLTISDRLKTA